MGHEIVYCYWCSGRILGADFEKGAAVLIGNHACCSQCLPKVMASLPDNQRETLLATLSKTPSRHTPRGGTEIGSTRTPRTGNPVVPAPPAGRRAPLPLVAIGAGVLVAAAVGLMFIGGGTREAPPERRDAALPPPPPVKPAVPDREKTARNAVVKARDAARAGIDIDLQVRLWDEAVSKSERTPSLDEATQERAAILVRRKEVYAQELTRLMDSVDGILRDDEFKKALDALASARKRHESPDWGPVIDRKIEEVKKTEAGGGAYRQGTDPDGIVCFEAERFHKKTDKADHAWTLVTAPPGFTGTGALSPLPNTNTGYSKDFENQSPRADYRVHFQTAGKYFVWIRGYAESGTDDSVHAGLDGKEVKSATAVTLSANKKWNWTTKTMAGAPAFLDVPSTGIHIVNLWMREDGAVIDRVVLTLNPKYSPKDPGPPESPR
ncbi:MAG: hypothetical protein HY293_20895 [Planctomycetes bacterium]|nr:hypothetical protein [Planctomycetota bacterium]